MELSEKKLIDKNLDLFDFEKYLELRRKQSKLDLELLSKNFDINLDYLKDVSYDIRKKLFLKDKANFTTTYHLIPWELYQYKLFNLKQSYLKENFQESFFDFFIYYGLNENEKLSQFNLGDLNLNLNDILDLKVSKRTQAIDFYHIFKNKFEVVKDSNQKEEFKNKLKKYIASRGVLKKYTNLEKDLIVDDIFENMFDLMREYFDFYENLGGVDNNIKIFNELKKELVSKQELKTIFEKLNLNENNFDLKENNKFIIGLICILGGINHVGAERPVQDESGNVRGFMNEVREKLNLPLLIEPQMNIFLERYNFTNPFYDALALKILFGEDAIFILDAAAKIGPQSFSFSPNKLDLIKKIRLLDFVRNYDEFLKQKINLDKFKEIILRNENYKEFLINFSDLENKDLSLEEFLASSSKLRFIFERYLKFDLAKIYQENPYEFLSLFKSDFDFLSLENLKTENLTKNDKIKFFGINLPLSFDLDFKDFADFIILKKQFNLT